MKELTIYLSLKEVENLIFNRIIEISAERLSVTKAQGLLSVSIKLNEKFLIFKDSKYFILFSAVKKFEAPEKEKTLFTLHYKVPEGLITLLDRQIRDVVNKDADLFSNTNDDFPKREYLLMRNGCVGMYNLTCIFSDNGHITESVKSILHSIFEGSQFRDTLLSGLLTNSTYPIKEIQTEKFVTERYFRVVWLLTIVKETLLSKIDSSMFDKIEITKKWMRDLLEIDDPITIIKCLRDFPEEFSDEINCLLGYYIAVTRFEDYKIDKDAYLSFLSNLEYKKKDELLTWAIFFLSIYDDEVPYLYFSPLIQNDIFEIEQSIYQLLSKELVSSIKLSSFNRSYSKEELIKNYLNLKTGQFNECPEIILEHEIETKLESNLNKNNLKKIGLEIDTSNYYNLSFVNTCSFKHGYFNLKLKQDTEFGEITFYTKKDSRCNEKLKSLGLKRKPIDKLLANKKVIIGFLYLDDFTDLIKIYSELTSEISSIEKIVIVSLVNLEPNQVQSLEFDNMYREYQSRISNLFNFKCEFIIRNERNKDTVEIKRNLKNAIGEYKTSQLEIIPDNLSHQKMRWIIDISREYWIEQETFNYYSFLSTAIN